MDVKPIFAEEVLYGGCFGTDKLVKVYIFVFNIRYCYVYNFCLFDFD